MSARLELLPVERTFAALSLGLLGLHLFAATRVGFGDSEALYATWAMHPQPAYLDHPGLVASVARAIGGGTVPTPERAHLLTSIVAFAVPLLALLVARVLGASRQAACGAAVVLLVTPQIAVGLFALTPDLLLAPLWLAAIGLAFAGLSAKPASVRASACLLFAGVAVGVATTAKVSGGLLALALLVTYASLALSPAAGGLETDAALARARTNARSLYPWVGLGLGAIVVLPVVLAEVRSGFPMLRHRLVDTQAGAGPSLRNLGAVVGGQLAYLSPVLAALAAVAAWDLVRARKRDVASRLLFATFAVPFIPLLALSVTSRVAEPHWLAPALLALPLHVARAPLRLAPARALRIGVSVAVAVVALVHAWVLVPSSARLVPTGADPRADLARELVGWPEVAAAVRAESALLAEGEAGTDDVVVIAPHWTLCAQLAATLRSTRVGCATPIKDDFDGFFPRVAWRKAARVVWVTDDVFGGDGARELPAHAQVGERTVLVHRGDEVARRFRVLAYARRQMATR